MKRLLFKSLPVFMSLTLLFAVLQVQPVFADYYEVKPKTNYALGKPATASSCYGDTTAALAVDGSEDTGWISRVYSQQASDPGKVWLCIDFSAGPIKVSEIYLRISRLNDDADSLKNYKIYGSQNAAFDDTAICLADSETGTGVGESARTFQVSNAGIYSYIYLVRAENQVDGVYEQKNIHVREIQVYGTEYGKMNAILTSSSDYTSATPAANANDGDLSTYWASKTYFQQSKPEGFQRQAYIAADLGGAAEVNTVKMKIANQGNTAATNSIKIMGSQTADFSSLNPDTDDVLYDLGTDSIDRNSMIPYNVANSGKTYQTIYVWNYAGDNFSVNELEIYGLCVEKTENLLSDTSLSVSSAYSERSSEELLGDLSDGLLSTFWTSKVSNQEDKSAVFIQADLGKTAVVENLKIKFRADDKYAYERRGFELRGSLMADFSDYVVLASTGDNETEVGTEWNVSLENSLPVRYLRVGQFNGNTSTSICELSITGHFGDYEGDYLDTPVISKNADGGYQAKVTCAAYGQSKDVCLILCVYEGKIMKKTASKSILFTDSGVSELTVRLSAEEVGTGDLLKAFVWNNLSDVKPYRPPVTAIAENEAAQ